MENNTQISNTPENFKYFNVSTKKLVVLSIVTFGIYEIYWFYKNWQIIKEQNNDKIYPFLWAIFWIFTCNNLFRKINISLINKGLSVKYSELELSTMYTVLVLIGNISRSFDNFIGVIFLVIGFFSVIPLVIVQKSVNLYNAAIDPYYKIDGRLNWKDISIMLFCLILVIVIILE